MKKIALLSIVAAFALTGCATTEYRQYESANSIIEGHGGAKALVDGMDFWDYGEPPRKYKIIGIIDDKRSGGAIPMSSLRTDVVKKAREAGGEAVIQIGNESRVTSYVSNGFGTATTTGRISNNPGPTRQFSANTTSYSSAITVHTNKNTSRFAVIRYID